MNKPAVRFRPVAPEKIGNIMKIGFIGIGYMGHGMAKNILEKGYSLKFKENIKNYIFPVIIKIKIIFVSIIFFVTVLVFLLLVFGDLSSYMKHMLEWNYFTILLIYYLFSRLLWCSK